MAGEDDATISFVRAADYYSKKFGIKREKITEAMDKFLKEYGWGRTFDHKFTETYIKEYCKNRR